ncbi:hypothetical protein Aca07nite_86240 [Actinoplanes capillaceus]|uniref:Uncharacterized protein n=1 Tax=Actinoplanes campanulatus TaxID=113559 RepID=A0ABQ3WYI2_9ACTN|nr:hypothetical protein [Actinoplanes capillaceus]GID51349.1 hypothetical protein Aca07nite_86240 [Actinoplanes capillaceus]
MNTTLLNQAPRDPTVRTVVLDDGDHHLIDTLDLDAVRADHLNTLGVPVLADLPIGPGRPPVSIGVPAVIDTGAERQGTVESPSRQRRRRGLPVVLSADRQEVVGSAPNMISTRRRRKAGRGARGVGGMAAAAT